MPESYLSNGDECSCRKCREQDVCIDCREEIEGTRHYIPTPEDERFWKRAEATTGPLCAACKRKRENAEGPDPLWDVAMPFARNH